MHERFIDFMPDDGTIDTGSDGLIAETPGSHVTNAEVGGGEGILLEDGTSLVISDDVHQRTKEVLDMWRSDNGGHYRIRNLHGRPNAATAVTLKALGVRLGD